MSEIPLIDPATAQPPAADLLAKVQRSVGAVPNMTRAMANSPALLNGYLQLSAALGAGVLPAATRERIALAVAQGNGCSYCLSAHSYVAERVNHLEAEEIVAARKAHADDPKTAAILSLAAVINDNRGDVPTGVLDSARGAGVTDEEIAETIGHVAFNVLTNYFNKAVDTDVDFPVVTP
jgi:uncharacterized peroxidase-related enzyme